MLQVEEVSVTFGGLSALRDVSIDADAGSITGLIGPNGAGKTTMFNVITGLQRPNSGRVLLDGNPVTDKGPGARARLGMGRTFQRLELFGSLSVLDNVRVALENRAGFKRSVRLEALQLLDRVGMADIVATQADVLPTGQARLLELARALAAQPRILLLDEPFSGLNGIESSRLGVLLEELTSEGLAVLLVEHDMEMVMRLCRRIHVLSFGSIIARGGPEAIKSDQGVQEAYLGTPSNMTALV